MDKIIQKLKMKAVMLSSRIDETDNMVDVLKLECELGVVYSQLDEYEAYKRCSEIDSYDVDSQWNEM